jgi:hypothetical protein
MISRIPSLWRADPGKSICTVVLCYVMDKAHKEFQRNMNPFIIEGKHDNVCVEYMLFVLQEHV